MRRPCAVQRHTTRTEDSSFNSWPHRLACPRVRHCLASTLLIRVEVGVSGITAVHRPWGLPRVHGCCGRIV